MQNIENFRASRNDLRASTSWLQLVLRAGWKIKLLCTLACNNVSLCNQFKHLTLAHALS